MSADASLVAGAAGLYSWRIQVSSMAGACQKFLRSLHRRAARHGGRRTGRGEKPTSGYGPRSVPGSRVAILRTNARSWLTKRMANRARARMPSSHWHGNDVQVVRRFVEQQQVRFRDECLRDERPAFLSAAERIVQGIRGGGPSFQHGFACVPALPGVFPRTMSRTVPSMCGGISWMRRRRGFRSCG